MDYQKKVALAWLVVNYNEKSEFPEYFAECFSLSLCQLHSGEKLELRRPGDVCCVVSTEIQSHTPGMEASPQSSPSPSPFLGIQCGQQSLWKLELSGGKSGHRKAGAQSLITEEMTLVWSLWGWLVQFPSTAAPCKVEGGKGRLVLSCLPPSHPFAFLWPSFSLPLMLLTEKLELSAWVLAGGGGLKTLTAVPVTKVLPPTEPPSSG